MATETEKKLVRDARKLAVSISGVSSRCGCDDCIESLTRYFVEFAEAALVAERERVEKLEKALVEISEGRGRFSLDHHQHAMNTIEDMKQAAVEALADSTTPPPPTGDEMTPTIAAILGRFNGDRNKAFEYCLRIFGETPNDTLAKEYYNLALHFGLPDGLPLLKGALWT